MPGKSGDKYLTFRIAPADRDEFLKKISEAAGGKPFILTEREEAGKLVVCVFPAAHDAGGVEQLQQELSSNVDFATYVAGHAESEIDF